MTQRKKTTIFVNDEHILLNRDDIPFPQFMAMVRAKAITGVKGKDGTYINTVHPDNVDGRYAQVVLTDQTATATKVNLNGLTKKQLIALIEGKTS